jgi:ParB-like chromosome segregation protein Spo0J
MSHSIAISNDTATDAAVDTTTTSATTKILTVTSTAIEEATNYGDFTLVDAPWLPEARECDALTKLIDDIKTDGLIHPIMVDEKNKVWSGRMRFLACKELGIPVKLLRIRSEEGGEVARRDLAHRDLTVLDRVKMVGSAIKTIEAKGDARNRTSLSNFMKSEYGWDHGASPKQAEHYQKLFDMLKDLNDEKIDLIRKAKTLNAAREALDLTSKAKASSGKLSMTKVREHIEKIVKEADTKADGSVIIKKLNDLLKQMPPTKATKAVAKEKATDTPKDEAGQAKSSKPKKMVVKPSKGDETPKRKSKTAA